MERKFRIKLARQLYIGRPRKHGNSACMLKLLINTLETPAIEINIRFPFGRVNIILIFILRYLL